MKAGPFIVVWGLTALFAWGKVVGHLDWSWWLVFILPLSAATLIVVGLIIMGVAKYLLDKTK